MQRLVIGDVDSLDSLISRHWAVVVDYAARMIRCEDQAEDLAQEAFVALWEGRREWTEGTRPRPLLLRMVRNRALNECRWREVRDRFEGRVRSIELGRRPPDPFEELKAKEVEDRFRQALAALSPRKREVFTMSRFQGLSYAEIAQVLGTSSQTVANQMSAALRELRQAISQPPQPYSAIAP